MGTAGGTSARIGVDIGGTFTDLVLSTADGRSLFRKLSSTPERPELAVIDGIGQILARAGLDTGAVGEVLHGTTVGSNTLLQKVGAATGLITTRGFRDVLEIGRVRTPDMFDLGWDKPEPLVRRRWRREVDERIAADGTVLRPIDPAEVMAVAGDLADAGVQSIAICFLNSYRNPVNELAAEAAVREALPDVAVTASVSVLAEIREYERTSTAVVNAYVLPAMRGYLRRLEAGLREIGIAAPLLVSDSNGGLAAAETAREKPVFFVSSGRSAGVCGAARLGRAADRPDLIIFDMGGTTASASLVHQGEISRASEYEFRAGISTPSRFIKAGGYMMRVPTVDVAEVGGGGGSIAWIDDGGLLSVGPLSAGADPGPACYGIGGDRPTVTDANVVLGYLPPALAGGDLPLDVERARAVIARDLATPLGLSVEQAAHGVRQVVNATMARAIRAVTVERGVDPREFALAAFGGSGPVHACELAASLDITRILLPAMPGVFTAVGMLTGDVERHFLAALPGLLDDLSAEAALTVLADLRRRAAAALQDEGFGPERTEFRFALDLRFEGQDSELPIALAEEPAAFSTDDLRVRFLEDYGRKYGYASADAVEVVNLRLLARGIQPHKLDFRSLAGAAAGAEGNEAGERQIYFGPSEGWLPAPVVGRAALGDAAVGPLVVESPDSTIVLPPGARLRPDDFGNLLVDLEAAS